MANIKDKLVQIRKAIFGRDVRESIASGIEEINKEVEGTSKKQELLETEFDQLIINAGSSNSEIVQARVGKDGSSYSSLKERLDKENEKAISKLKEVDSVIKNNGTKIYAENSKTASEGPFAIANFAGQESGKAAPIGAIIHHYTDGILAQFDNVGDKNDILILKNATNKWRRPDKPSDFVGTGNFLVCLRNNLGAEHSDRMFMVDSKGNLYWFDKKDTVCLGTNKEDNGTFAFELDVFKAHKKLLMLTNSYQSVLTIINENGELKVSACNNSLVLSSSKDTIIDATNKMYINKLPLIYDGENYATPLRRLTGSKDYRPKNANVGEYYFDTYLEKPIFCKKKCVLDTSGNITTGAIWIDAMGNIV
ncbi:hypothetical protein NX821_001141 [Clostridium septicum]|uniref:hypothetical protein n=1 Tax=Clostridium septicum TaxID=1504 RepID=UPI003216A991